MYLVPMHIAHNLSQQIILGSKFLQKQRTLIDFGTQKIRLHKKSCIRVVSLQVIPPHSQSVVRAKISNKLPKDTI